jgi:mannosyltransferase
MTTTEDSLAGPTTERVRRPGSDRTRRRALTGPRRERARDALVLVAPALLAAGLCLYQLTTRSLWLDESATVAISSQHGAAFGTALAHDGGNMLGYYALMHVLIGIFGNGALLIRLPSALAAAVTVAVVSRLALRLFDRRVALAAGLLSAVSLPLVFWGQDARGYAPMIALVAASFLALEWLLDSDPRDWRPWLAYFASITAAVYCGLEAVLVVPAQLVVLAWHRERTRSILAALALSAICCAPLAVLAAGRGSAQLFWVPSPSLRILNQVLQALTSAAIAPSFSTSTTTVLLVGTLVVLAVGAWRTWRLLRTDTRAARGPVLLFAWLLAPPVLALIESVIGQSIFQARYLLVSLPAVAILLAWSVATLVPAISTPRSRHLLPLAVFGALLVLRALQLAPSYGYSFENWRGATSYVLAHTQSGDCVAFYPSDGRQAFKYYLGSRPGAPRPILPPAAWGEIRSYVEDYSSLSASQLARLPSECPRVWLISRNQDRVGGPPATRADYKRFQRLQNDLRVNYPREQRASFGYGRSVVVALFAR